MFSERLAARKRAWWSSPFQLADPSAFSNGLVRVVQRRQLLSRDDPIEKWHKGKHWQRRLNNKWNSREFAVKHGFQVPELYWLGRNPANIPFTSLPPHYVIRRAWGAGSRDVYLMENGKDLLREKLLSNRDLVKSLKTGHSLFYRFPVLVEEFLKSPQGVYEPPAEFSFHMFAGELAIIVVQQGRQPGQGSSRLNFYTPDWKPLEHSLRIQNPQRTDFERPDCFDDMLECAEVLGRAYGTYVRVDLYPTDKGCVFGEFCSLPAQGSGFSEYADELLGTYWDQNCGEQI
jgi:hypothetical protein